MSYAAPYWATPQPTDLRRTLLSYALPYWATPHPLIYAAPYWATPHPFFYTKIFLSRSSSLWSAPQRPPPRSCPTSTKRWRRSPTSTRRWRRSPTCTRSPPSAPRPSAMSPTPSRLRSSVANARPIFFGQPHLNIGRHIKKTSKIFLKKTFSEAKK